MVVHGEIDCVKILERTRRIIRDDKIGILINVERLANIGRLEDVDKRKALPSILGRALVHGTH